MEKSLTVAALIKSLQACRNKDSYVFAYDGEGDERSPIVAVDDSFYEEENGPIPDVDLNIVRPISRCSIEKKDPRNSLRQVFACLPGDVISKSRFVIEEQDWHDKLTEKLTVLEISMEEDDACYYVLVDENDNKIVLTGTDFI